MKKTLLLCALLVLSITLLAQNTGREIFMEYWNNPTQDNFQIAYEYFIAEIAADSTYHSDTATTGNMAFYYLFYMHHRERLHHLNVLKENIDNYPPGVRFGIANMLLSEGKFTEAIEIYEKINAAIPNWSCPFRHKGEAYFKMRDFPNAEAALLKAIETRETHYDAYLMLAEVYIEQNKKKPALQAMEKAFKVLGAEDEDPEEAYSFEERDFLWLRILKANKDKRAKAVEAELKTKYPDKF